MIVIDVDLSILLHDNSSTGIITISMFSYAISCPKMFKNTRKRDTSRFKSTPLYYEPTGLYYSWETLTTATTMQCVNANNDVIREGLLTSHLKQRVS